MSTSSAYTIGSGHRSQQGHLVVSQDHFLSHAGSSLVALSVLFGSMFVAHSALVQVEGEELLEGLFAAVYTVRGSIASIPQHASTHIASIQLSNADKIIGSEPVLGNEYAASVGFSAGGEVLYGLNVLAEPLIKGMIAQEETLIYKDLYASINKSAADPGELAITSVGISALSIGEFIGDSGNIAVKQLPAVSDAVLGATQALRGGVAATYVRSTEILVNSSYIVAETLVRTAYTIGDQSVDVVATGIPAISATYDAAIVLWVEETNKIAANILEDQVMVGNQVLSIASSVRDYSSETQRLAGVAIAEAAQGTGEQLAESTRLFTTSSTAALGNFLLLEPAN